MKMSAIFPARLEALAAACGLLERFCAAGGVGREDCLRLNLVLEEFFTNTEVWACISRASFPRGPNMPTSSGETASACSLPGAADSDLSAETSCVSS
ncbi:MAG: hypothetical protein P8Y76_15760 [bacterium]